MDTWVVSFARAWVVYPGMMGIVCMYDYEHEISLGQSTTFGHTHPGAEICFSLSNVLERRGVLSI